jgi:hypothetical protein
MKQMPVQLTAMMCFWMLTTVSASAQISFGVTQQNGVVTGGSFQVGGFVMPGGTGVRLGITAGTSQLIGLQNFTFQNASNNTPVGGNATSRPSPKFSAGQFVRATKRFDKNEDGQLDVDELNKVAAAVVAEFRKLNGHSDQTPSIQVDKADETSSTSSAEQMVEAFVKRSLTFDKDEDKVLNSAETKRMAAALVRSLNATAGQSGYSKS